MPTSFHFVVFSKEKKKGRGRLLMVAAITTWIQHSSSGLKESMRKKVKGQYHYGIIKTGKQERA